MQKRLKYIIGKSVTFHPPDHVKEGICVAKFKRELCEGRSFIVQTSDIFSANFIPVFHPPPSVVGKVKRDSHQPHVQTEWKNGISPLFHGVASIWYEAYSCRSTLIHLFPAPL